jgi:hypothetical protein
MTPIIQLQLHLKQAAQDRAREGTFSTKVMPLIGPELPVDLTTCCVAPLPEADVGPYCSILAMQVRVVRTERPVSSLDVRAGRQ